MDEEKVVDISEEQDILADLFEESPELQALASLLSLDDEQFEAVSPVVLQDFVKGINSPDSRLNLSLILASSQESEEDYVQAILDVNAELQNLDTLSDIKKEFCNDIVTVIITAIRGLDGLKRHTVTVPIELCHEDAKLPQYANITDAGMDVYALEEYHIAPGETKLIPTGIKVAIPQGYAILVHPRSGKSLKSKMRICNSIGLIDAGYRGEIGVIVENVANPIESIEYDFDEHGHPVITSILHGSDLIISKGERFAQLRLVEVPMVSWAQIDSIDSVEGDRNGGFGSSGTN